LELDGTLKIPSLTLNGSDLSDTLGTKQSALQFSGDDTSLTGFRTVNASGNVRNLLAGSNAGLSLSGNTVTLAVSSTPSFTSLRVDNTDFVQSLFSMHNAIGGGTVTVKNSGGSPNHNARALVESCDRDADHGVCLPLLRHHLPYQQSDNPDHQALDRSDSQHKRHLHVRRRAATGLGTRCGTSFPPPKPVPTASC
jgi:hypothetical protein